MWTTSLSYFLEFTGIVYKVLSRVLRPSTTACMQGIHKGGTIEAQGRVQGMHKGDARGKHLRGTQQHTYTVDL